MNLQTDSFQLLVDTVISTLVEGIVNFQNQKITVYHSVGQAIATNELYHKGEHGNRELISKLTQAIKEMTEMPLGEKLIYECILFYEKNPDIEKYLLSKEKNWSWSKTRLELHGAQQSKDKVKKCLNCPFHCEVR